MYSHEINSQIVRHTKYILPLEKFTIQKSWLSNWGCLWPDSLLSFLPKSIIFLTTNQWNISDISHHSQYWLLVDWSHLKASVSKEIAAKQSHNDKTINSTLYFLTSIQ